MRGGQYNVYGNSTHFNSNLYTNYKTPTIDAFNLISQYLSRGLTTAASAYKVYEGEASWAHNLGPLTQTQTAPFGNPGNIRYSCDSDRTVKLAAALGAH